MPKNTSNMYYLPMLARPAGKEELKKAGFIYEPKLDGTRTVCYKDEKGIRFINSRGNDITARYPEFSFIKEIDRCQNAKRDKIRAVLKSV